jgi:hypothetical protein
MPRMLGGLLGLTIERSWASRETGPPVHVRYDPKAPYANLDSVRFDGAAKTLAVLSF